MSKIIVLIITVVFLFSTTLVFGETADWSNIDLTHKEQKKDSVDWSNIDLMAKKPKPDDGQRDWPGEKTGVCGPIIVHGGKEKDEALVVLGSSGAIKCTVKDREAVKKIVDSAKKVVLDACRWATKDDIWKGLKFDYLKEAGQEDLTPDEFLSYENINDLKILEDQWFGLDLDSNYFVCNALARYPVSGFAADSVMVLQLGLTEQELEDIISKVFERFMSGYRKDNFFQDFQDMLGVYIIEIILPRTVQNEEYATVPNDPLFLKVGKLTGSKKGGLGGIAGGLLKVGGGGVGVSIGGGAAKKSGASDQWAIRKVGFKPLSSPESAWNIEDGSKKNVIVAVIDSGLDMQHPDGPQYIWTNSKEIPDNKIDDDKNGYIDDIHGWNFIEENNDLTDKKGHGTFVSGIIAAKTNNGIGIAGINPGAQIMVLKVADEKGVANSLNIYRALRYAADNGAKIINISLGDRGKSWLEQLGINYAYAKGAFIVVAAGNQAGNISRYGPCALRRGFVVGMLNFEGTRSIISNFGENLALLAPGEDIYSLHSQDAEWDGPSMERERLYTKKTGTSFSAPIVAATASLLLAKNPNLRNEELESLLLNTATDLDEEGWDVYNGAGLLNAYAALNSQAENIIVVMPTEVVIKEDKNGISSVGLFGIIKGGLDSYSVEIGRGKNPKKWEKVTETKPGQVEYGLIAVIDKSLVSYGQEYVAKITARDKTGNTKVANIYMSLKGEKK